MGLGAQKLIADIISGLFIIFERPFLPGDIIQIEGFIGTVESLEPENNLVRASVSMMGKDVLVELELSQVEALS